MPFDGAQLNQTAADLLAAKRYLETHGWIQGAAGVDGGPRCIVGASNSVTNDLGRLFDLRDTFAAVVGCPSKWNDRPGRTVDEVYALFDKAIAMAMEQNVNA